MRQWKAFILSLSKNFDKLKTERVHHRVYATREEARRDLFAYIEGFYNSHRLHPALGYSALPKWNEKQLNPVHFFGRRSVVHPSFGE